MRTAVANPTVRALCQVGADPCPSGLGRDARLLLPSSPRRRDDDAGDDEQDACDLNAGWALVDDERGEDHREHRLDVKQNRGHDRREPRQGSGDREVADDLA